MARGAEELHRSVATITTYQQDKVFKLQTLHKAHGFHANSGAHLGQRGGGWRRALPPSGDALRSFVMVGSCKFVGLAPSPQRVAVVREQVDTSSTAAFSVSVVIPVCNGRLWLGDCLRSLAQQTGVVLEVLLVDDGSTDGSLPLAEQIWQALAIDWPLRTLKTSEAGRPAGVSEARNLGWRSASHSLVAFLDADDLAFPSDSFSRPRHWMRTRPWAT